MLEARYPLARPQLRSGRTLPEHQRILDAVASGDPAAAREAMEAHLASVQEFLGEYADAQGAERTGAAAASLSR
jgi:DNA-binding FadR family transcriptional regulator